jgi:hypothetical protein
MIRASNDFSYEIYESFANGIIINRSIRENALTEIINIFNLNKIEYFICYGSNLN